jgi:hypothetical protein
MIPPPRWSPIERGTPHGNLFRITKDHLRCVPSNIGPSGIFSSLVRQPPVVSPDISGHGGFDAQGKYRFAQAAIIPPA